MMWSDYYLAPDKKIWQGRPDLPASSCYFQIMKMLNLADTFNPSRCKPNSFALLGFCCDEGIRRNYGRVGAAEGPYIIRERLAALPLRRNDITCYDAGYITCRTKDLEPAQSALAEAVFVLLKHGIVPIVIGGGHELAWGHYQGILKKYVDQQIGILNFDAHFDMRSSPNQESSSGTSFLQIAKHLEQTRHRFDYNCIGIQEKGNITTLFETAKNYAVNYISADEIHTGRANLDHFINQAINNNDFIYLSICLDVFASPYAPGVSAPQILGLTPWQIIPSIRKVAASQKVLSYDIAELCPQYDIDYRTAKLAASLISEIIHHHLL